MTLLLRSAPTAEEEFDVVVVGGGAGGLAAAVGAARCGARTLLVERYGFLGGAATNAHVLSYCGFFKQGESGPEQTVRGVGEALLVQLRAMGLDTTPVRARSGNWIVMLDTEAVKLACDRLVADAGVQVCLHSLLVAADREGDHLHALTLADHAGLRTVRARAFVDATGEADLSCLAGVPLSYDSKIASHCQPASLPIRIGGVPATTSIDRERLATLIAEFNLGAGGGGLTRSDGGVLARLPLSGDLWSMVVDVGTDGISAADLTRAETRSRALAWEFVQLLRRLPGCERAHLVATGPQLGIRESRRPRAEADVSAHDAHQGKLRPDDGIARASWPMEVHEAPGRARFMQIGGNGHFDISHAALMPRGVTNLRLAGRVIGSDAQAYGSIRVMGTAFATGHAAGVSAALHRGRTGIDVPAIRRAMSEQGALL